MFYPGETDVQNFTIGYKADTISKGVITYEQLGKVVLEKPITEFTPVEDDEESCSFSVALSQEDTLHFADNESVLLQINLYFTDETRKASDPFVYQVGKQTYREVMA